MMDDVEILHLVDAIQDARHGIGEVSIGEEIEVCKDKSGQQDEDLFEFGDAGDDDDHDQQRHQPDGVVIEECVDSDGESAAEEPVADGVAVLVLRIQHEHEGGCGEGEEYGGEKKKGLVEVQEQQEEDDRHIGGALGELADVEESLDHQAGEKGQQDGEGLEDPRGAGEKRVGGLVKESLVVGREYLHLGDDAEHRPGGQSYHGNELYDGVFV